MLYIYTHHILVFWSIACHILLSETKRIMIEFFLEMYLLLSITKILEKFS